MGFSDIGAPSGLVGHSGCLDAFSGFAHYRFAWSVTTPNQLFLWAGVEVVATCLTLPLISLGVSRFSAQYYLLYHRSVTAISRPRPGPEDAPIRYSGVMADPKRRKPPAADLPAAAWPDALPEDVSDETKLAAGLARRLDKARGSMSYRDTENVTGISHQTISNIIRGHTWPDLHTIVTLETKLGVRLWSDEHLPTKLKWKR